MTRGLSIGREELAWRFSTSGGPGGQHANKASTRVEVRFDIIGSPSLAPRQRTRLLGRLGPVVRLSVSEERSQARNREIAVDRLVNVLADALRDRRERRATLPTAASRQRRLDAKKRRSRIKRDRAAGDG